MKIVSALPDLVIHNSEIESRLNLPFGWIVERTGIRERRFYDGGISSLAIRASNELLEKYEQDPLSIDVVVLSTVTPDHLWPATACKVAHEIGAHNAWAFDISAACSGFLYSMQTVRALISSGLYKKILLINGDCMSSIIDPMDKNTSVLFGDGCAASLWTQEEVEKIQYLELGADGGEYNKIIVDNYGSDARHVSTPYLRMDGRGTFKLAIQTMANSITKALEALNLSIADIDWVIPHQANKRIIDAITDMVGMPPEKVLTNLEWVGNTTNASIPLCYTHHQNKIEKNQRILICSFGAGVTWGAGVYVC